MCYELMYSTLSINFVLGELRFRKAIYYYYYYYYLQQTVKLQVLVI